MKCEKFYLGFDIGGWKLPKFRRGETEYGIGILPLGGYVKMLGQQDNPAGSARRSTAKLPPDKDGQPRVSAAELESAPPRCSIPAVPRAERAAADGDHFRGHGDEPDLRPGDGGRRLSRRRARVHCRVGRVIPGEGAWRADLRPGDEILEVNGRRVVVFDDILEAVTWATCKTA